MKELWSRYAYVATTILNSSIAFIKSYLFMDVLSKPELGYIALFQSLIVVVSFFQIGVIHGGYRLVSFSMERRANANDAVMSYLMCLYVLALLCVIVYSFFFSFQLIWAAGLFVGLFSLWGNWMTNLQIALGRTRRLSILMLVSILTSLTAIPVLFNYSLIGAVLLLTIQPIIFVGLSYLFNYDFRFSLIFKINNYLILSIKYGFIPFLTGILYYLNLQIERFIIGYDLGIAQLGEYYLVFVYTGVFLVIPGALATIHFPKMMKKIRMVKPIDYSFANMFGSYYIELGLYLCIVIVGTIFLMPIMVAAFLPEQIHSMEYVKIIMWGLVLFTLIDPISFIINAKLHYKQLIYIYLGALLVSFSAYTFIYLADKGSLLNYAYINVLFFSTVSLGYLLYFFLKGKKSLTLLSS